MTTANLGKPDYNKALLQHYNYRVALEKCGLEIIELKADEKYPDSTFVEDTAVANEDCAIITNLGAPSRKGEEEEIKKAIRNYRNHIELIEKPGTLEGGDVLRVEDNYFVGLSNRTNKAGAHQLKIILEKYGYSCTMVKLINFLHLKTGVAYIGDNNLVASGEFINSPIFKDFNIIKVDKDESYATNCIKVNKNILIAKGFEKLKTSISEIGYEITEIKMSEFRKMDGGLSCLSIRF
ncbi:MAG: dimethylarginine dimethylaminohydrolase family protein [Promethearchaeota archaeon]